MQEQFFFLLIILNWTALCFWQWNADEGKQRNEVCICWRSWHDMEL